MANNSKINKFMAISPYFELFIRRIYRSGFFNKILSSYNKKRFHTKPDQINFSKIIQHLEEIGIKQGDIVIVHSSYFSFIKSGLSPSNIVEKIVSLVGDLGTVVMPVIRRYPEEPPEKEALTADISDIIFEYNVQKSRVWTGMISYSLMRKKGSVTSRFPLNTITAYGAHAEIMIKNELEGELPTPNGKNSAWKYCLDNNAWCISLGTDLANSITMQHTFEDLNRATWPVKNWYREKKFKIIDGSSVMEKTVLERHPKWGMLHNAERTLCKDLLKEKVMDSKVVEGVLIESLKSKEFFDFLERKNQKTPGYPYYCLKN